MPRAAYSEKDRERIREALVEAGLELMSRQGVQHTTVEQIYKRVGISRTFFYSFFPTKEDLIVEALYLQQPRIIAYAKRLMADPSLGWREAARQFLYSCCYGEQHGIAILTIEEQQLIFKRLSKESYQLFRQKQRRLFGEILESLDGLDLDSARRVSGNGFYYLLGNVARLHSAVLTYARDFMINKGFTYCIPPYMIRSDVVTGVMSFEEMDAMMYKIEGEDLYLIGTSEHSMIGKFKDQILRK